MLIAKDGEDSFVVDNLLELETNFLVVLKSHHINSEARYMHTVICNDASEMELFMNNQKVLVTLVHAVGDAGQGSGSNHRDRLFSRRRLSQKRVLVG